MNIKVQCCGIVLMLVLSYFYIRQKKVRLNTEKAFWRIFCVTLICICLDILSLFAIKYKGRLPGIAVDMVCKSYLASLVLVALCSLIYICVDIYNKRAEYKRVLLGWLCIAAPSVLIIYLLPIRYYVEEGEISYTYGPAVLATYISAFLLLVATLWYTTRERARINPRRREAVVFWMAIWICAAWIQFIRNDLLIVGYACSIGIMVMYLKLENPDTNLDRKTGLFNYSAMMQYMRQLYGREESFPVLSVILERTGNRFLQADSGDDIEMEVIQYLYRIENVQIFKNSGDEIIIIFRDRGDAGKWAEELGRRFQKGWGKNLSEYIQPDWIYIPDAAVVENEEELLHIMRYARQNFKKLSENGSLCIDKGLVAHMRREREIEQMIVDAVEKDRVEVYYQPIFSTRAHRFTSAEALVRIRDEEGKIVPPGVFIDIAEQNGMILRLGEKVFDKVCRLLGEIDPERYGLHYIEVNLSVVQCGCEHLADIYINIMKKYNLDPHLINLEITESASMRAKKVLLDNMHVLMDYGVRFTLDDFGTGQSNLNYIVDMPVDIVKFDREMSQSYFANGRAKYVMDAAMHMIQGMKLEIVSEGIETEEQYRTMEALGISYIQGYYFSKPLPEKEFLEFLAEKNRGKM